jgi:hypothetical protein
VSLKNPWEAVIRNFAPEDFALAFWQWFERAKKCIQMGGDFIKKAYKLKIILPPTSFFY